MVITLNKKIYYSKFFLGLFLACHVVFYLLGENVSNYFSLNPQLIFYNLEIWRLLTYPFVSLSIAEVFLLIYVFWTIAPRIETIIQKNSFPLLIVGLIPFQGLLITALFAREHFYLRGTEGISFFILTLYFLISFRIVNQYEPISFRSMVQTAFVVVFWIMAATVDSFIYQRSTLVISFSFAMCGICLGSISYFQVRTFAFEQMSQRFKQYQLFKKRLEEIEEINRDTEIKSSVDVMVEESSTNKLSFDFEFTEEQLNKILDKISETGIESLSAEEITFLNKYSEILKNKEVNNG